MKLLAVCAILAIGILTSCENGPAPEPDEAAIIDEHNPAIEGILDTEQKVEENEDTTVPQKQIIEEPDVALEPKSDKDEPAFDHEDNEDEIKEEPEEKAEEDDEIFEILN